MGCPSALAGRCIPTKVILSYLRHASVAMAADDKDSQSVELVSFVAGVSLIRPQVLLLMNILWDADSFADESSGCSLTAS